MSNDSEQDSLFQLSSGIGDCLTARGQTITAVESCTAGGVAYALTMVPGSSKWFHRSFVTYTNQAKTDLVGVPQELFIAYGAVSLEVATAMSQGAQKAALADYSIAVTGIAGPGGGSRNKPVGTVCFGWADSNSEVSVEQMLFTGNRKSIREQSIHHALMWMLSIIKKGR